MVDKSKIVFSYSIYGNQEKYTCGLLKNIRILLEKGFNVHISYSNITDELYTKLIDNGILMTEFKFRGGSEGMLHRIFDIIDYEFEFFFIRDADSIISDYEIGLCFNFIESGRDLHIIRNHPLHNMPIMGGLFGGNRRIRNILRTDYFQKLFREGVLRAKYQTDQKLLIGLYTFGVSKLIHASHHHFFFETVDLISFDPLNYLGMDHSVIPESRLSLGSKEPLRFTKVILKIYKWVLINRVLSLLQRQKL